MYPSSTPLVPDDQFHGVILLRAISMPSGIYSACAGPSAKPR
jgi:hypothetical protein